MKHFEIKEDMSIEELLKELNSIDDVDVRVEFVEDFDDLNPKVVTSKDIRTDLERIMILIEEQKEYDIAIEKLKELYGLFEEMEWGNYELELKWD